MTQIYETKFESEVLTLEVDFSNRMIQGETVVTAASVVTLQTGTDPNPNAVRDGNPTVNTPRVYQQVQGGIPGNVYSVNISVRTSLNNILLSVGSLAIRSDEAVLPA